LVLVRPGFCGVVSNRCSPVTPEAGWFGSSTQPQVFMFMGLCCPCAFCPPRVPHKLENITANFLWSPCGLVGRDLQLPESRRSWKITMGPKIPQLLSLSSCRVLSGSLGSCAAQTYFSLVPLAVQPCCCFLCRGLWVAPLRLGTG